MNINTITLCPEREVYRSYINNNENWQDKDFAKKKKVLQEQYKLAFHNYVSEVYPHLLFERTNDKIYWNYDELRGIYQELSFTEVRSLIIKLLINEDLMSVATEAFSKLVLNRYRASNHERGMELEDFSIPHNWLHVNNGWLNLETEELQPHTPERFSLSKMDTDYDPTATCPLYDQFLDVDTQMPQDQVRVIDQFSGYILTDGIEQHTCLIFEGRIGCGKSMLTEIWMDMLGNKGVSLQLTSLQNGGERFIGQTLAHKNLCWFDEANPRTTSINEFFQNLITGDKIRIERKGVQGDDYVRNTMKVVLSLNEMPDHMPVGMDRRYRHIVFHRSFHEEGIVDKTYKQRLLAAEKSGVLNRMLRGLRDLRKMGKLTEIQGEDERKREYALTSDDFSSFLADHFDPTPTSDKDVRYTYEELRNAFVAEYPKGYNKQLTVRGFNKKLLSTRLPEFKYITTGRTKSQRGYRGLKLKYGHDLPGDKYEPIRVLDALENNW